MRDLALSLLRNELQQAEHHRQEAMEKNLRYIQDEFIRTIQQLESLAGDVHLFGLGEISLKQLRENAAKTLK